VVLTQERDYLRRPSRLSDTYFRRFPAAAESLSTRWRRYNQTREEPFDPESSGDAYLFVPDRMSVGNTTIEVVAVQAGLVPGHGRTLEPPRWRSSVATGV